MHLGKPLEAVKLAISGLMLPKTDLSAQVCIEPGEIESAASYIPIDVRDLKRGLYFFSLKYTSDSVPLGPRLTAARPKFETSDHIYTFVSHDQSEFFGTVLIIDDIEYLNFYPSRLPCDIKIIDCSLRQINSFARDYIYGELFVRVKIFGAHWTWNRSLDEFKAWVQRLLSGGKDESYATWWKLYGQTSSNELDAQRTLSRGVSPSAERITLDQTLSISVVLMVGDKLLPELTRSVDSMLAQTYADWELYVCGDIMPGSREDSYLQQLMAGEPRINSRYRSGDKGQIVQVNDALTETTGAFVGFLEAGDQLAANALFEVALCISDSPELLMVYSDEDAIGAGNVPLAPQFKPDWNYDLFLSINYVCHFLVIAKSQVMACKGLRIEFEGAEILDLTLRVVESASASQIGHIPKVLYHRSAGADELPEHLNAFESNNPEVARSAINDHLQRRNLSAVATHTEVPGGYRITYQLPDPPPSVSIIIPTYNSLRVLKNCVETLLEKTNYPAYEILIVDNLSDDPATLNYLAAIHDHRIRVLRYQSEFNFSAINNYAVKASEAQILVLLNNDTEVCNEDWLIEIVSQVSRPEIGAVGAKLFYAEGRIQHAGVLLGMGPDRVAGHAFKGFHRDEIGAMGRTRLVQQYHANTGACLAVSRELYLEVGGLDEENLAIAFNDVDFCLKLRAAGYLNLWTPYAQMYHYESYSRGYDVTEEKRNRFILERDYMHRRWGDWLQSDSNYNPNLTGDFDNFNLAWPPESQVVGTEGVE